MSFERKSSFVDWKSALARWRSPQLLQTTWRHGLTPTSGPALAFATACVILATLVRLGLGLVTSHVLPFSTYYPAILVSTLVGGLRAGIVAAVLGGVIGFWFFTPELAPVGLVAQVVNVLVYFAASLIIIWGGEQYRGMVRQFDQEEHYRQLLVGELGHRVHNKLAAIQAILRHELRSHAAVWEAVSRRLEALAATDEFIAKSPDRGVDLREVLRTELSPYDEARANVDGEPVYVAPKLAVTLALIFHELATNAAKHGAFSTSAGRLTVSWHSTGGFTTIEWRERDGPPVAEPTHRGFGRRLIEEGLRAFGGRVECAFDPAGLVCIITVPSGKVAA